MSSPPAHFRRLAVSPGQTVLQHFNSEFFFFQNATCDDSICAQFWYYMESGPSITTIDISNYEVFRQVTKNVGK